MKNSMDFILILSLLTTLIMTLLSRLSNRNEKRLGLEHLTQFWASLFTNILLYLIVRKAPEVYLGLAMLGWIWPLKTMKSLLEDFSGELIIKSWAYYAVITGGLLSLGLTLVYPLQISSIPFSLAVGLTGVYLLRETFLKLTPIQKTPILLTSFFFLGLLFLERLTFFYWGPSAPESGYLLLLLSTLGLGPTLMAALFENESIKQMLETENLLFEKNKRLMGQSKFSELGMMSAGIAHEINNPLAVIQARTTQLLRIYRNPDKQADLADGLQQILYTSDRINKTIQGVREFIHQDEKTDLCTISLSDLFDDVLAFCGQRMKNHGINLRFYGIEEFTVVGNKIQLEQIVLNLLNNSFDAIEYLPDKWIEVSCHPHGESLRIYFKDSGSGIPMEISAKMMEPFFSTKDLGKGTGLGLALARGIAEKHKGTLQYLDDCPHTTFVLEIPVNLNQDWGDNFLNLGN